MTHETFPKHFIDSLVFRSASFVIAIVIGGRQVANIWVFGYALRKSYASMEGGSNDSVRLEQVIFHLLHATNEVVDLLFDRIDLSGTRSGRHSGTTLLVGGRLAFVINLSISIINPGGLVAKKVLRYA